MTDKYKLVGREVVPVDDLFEWGEAMEVLRRADKLQIGHDMVGNIEVSTIFMGLDMRIMYGEPQLFETMVFEWPIGGGPRRAMDTYRYSTYDQAEESHKAIVNGLRNKLQ